MADERDVSAPDEVGEAAERYIAKHGLDSPLVRGVARAAFRACAEWMTRRGGD